MSVKPQPSKQRVRQTLLTWFAKNRRDLPWRLPAGRQAGLDPYLIAVSEVMLQQTQVERVVPKFLAWRRAWPTTASLARAPLRDVLTLWSGLGYNSRAMRLRDAARIVIRKYHGRWPRTVEELEVLPGFGPYTARAMASFAYHQDVPAMDTNIRRVVSRIFFGVRPVALKKIEQKATELVPKNNSATWHSTLMDFGSAVCTSRNPHCETCPVQKFCDAYPTILHQPVKHQPQRKPFKVTDRYWRGRIIQHLIETSPQSINKLCVHLNTLGLVDKERVVRLLDNMKGIGIVIRRGNSYRIGD